jgi:hypothetical protein
MKFSFKLGFKIILNNNTNWERWFAILLCYDMLKSHILVYSMEKK